MVLWEFGRDIGRDCRLGRVPVGSLLGPLLACGGFPDVLPYRASAPAPQNHDEQAHDEECDPNQEEDDAGIVDVEPRSLR